MREILSVIWRRVLLLPPREIAQGPPPDPGLDELHEQVRAELSAVRIRRAPGALDWKKVSP